MSINRCPLRYAHSEGFTGICYSEDGSQMITCGNDGDIRIWAGIDDTDPESFCVGECVLSIAQKGDNIYVCRDDGRVMILKYPEGERNGILSRFTAPATHITVSKNESIIVCVSEDSSVKVYNSPQDVNCTVFNEPKGPVLGAAISSNEELLAASSGDGNIYIWNLKKKELLKTIECVPRINNFTSAKILCLMSFDPRSKYMAYPEGTEIKVVDVENFDTKFILNTDKVKSSYSIVQFSPCGAYIAASTTEGDICIWRSLPGSEPAISIHEQKYNVCSFAWNPEEKGELCFCDKNGQVGRLEYTPKDDVSLSSEIQITADSPNAFDIENNEDDENVISLEKLKNDTLGLNIPSPASVLSINGSREPSPERSRSPPCTLQPPFQPGSTPIHLAQRFMVFNDIGIVRHFTEEDDSLNIDIQFHDTSFHKSLFMRNPLNHTMASLSSAVLALASETPSKLVCIPLKIGTKEWSVEMSDLEEILCISASSSIVAVATNCRMLRIFSVFGSQLAVVSIPGPAVSITSFKNYVLVIFHACTAHSKDQNLSGMLVQLNGSDISSKIVSIPITPQSTLTWVGFTDVGSLATYDSAGLLRICKLDSCAWIPVCDSSIHAKGASDSYFLISVWESSQILRVIHCKGAIYPATTPTPIIHEMPMQVPLCEPDTDKSQMEDKIIRWSIFETEQPERAFKETAIKLFALACRNNLDDRAYELLEIIRTPQLINIALKYSSKLGKTRLVEKLQELLKRSQGEESIVKEDTSNISIKPIIHRSLKRKTNSIPVVESQQTESQQISQDMFPNTSSSDISEFKDGNTPRPVRRNPFLKTNTENKRNPLSLTNANDEHITLAPVIADLNSETENTKIVTESNKIEGRSFTSWFQEKKPEIEKEHPELSPAELVKFALKLFKKRKANDDDDENNSQRSKQPKLTCFAFTKS